MKNKVRKQLKNKLNKKCAYFPCHDPLELESCEYCYCDKYPCCDYSKGNWINEMWDCSHCTEVHKLSYGKDNK